MKMVIVLQKAQPTRRGRLVHAAIVIVFCVALKHPCRGSAQVMTGADLQKQIQIDSAAALHADPQAAGRIWWHLGSLYEDAGRYTESETAYGQAIRLLRSQPAAEAYLARAIDDLGTLYMMRGDTQQAESAEQQALKIREANGLSADLPRSWYHLATLSLSEHRFEKAREYAEHAVGQLSAEARPDADDQLNARFVLGAAFCRLHRYTEAIAMMQKAMEVARRTYQPEDFPSGFGSFLLGYAYWKSGNAAAAQHLMEDGAEVVEKQLGWRHPVCQTIMAQYALFLRRTHQKQTARQIEGKLKQAHAAERSQQGSGALSVASLF